MGKRKHKRSSDHIKRKIKKLERRLRRRHSSESNSDDSSPDGGNCANSRVSEQSHTIEQTDSDASDPHPGPKSSAHVVEISHQAEQDIPVVTVDPSNAAACNNSIPPTLPADILDLLGDPKGKEEHFGPKIQEEISKRWGSILCEGLNKDLKKGLTEKILVPDNFQLIKAPKLNIEISAVLSESHRNRDKYLEKIQNQLGLGISALTTLASNLIDNQEIDKIEMVRRLSEANQIFLDLHFENTTNRRKLITNSLDKKFIDIIQDVKRDGFLFGENLGDKIKANKSAEKSGLQIKKVGFIPKPSTSKTNTQQENRRVPPRQAQRGNRQGGAKNRINFRSMRRSAPMTNRYQDSTKQRSRPQSKTQ